MKKHDSFEIDSAGEEVAYIGLSQAMLEARKIVRREEERYCSQLGWDGIVWTEVRSERRDDYYWIILRFTQPARDIAEAQTGEEEFVIDEVGNLIDRQVLVWPDATPTNDAPKASGSKTRRRRKSNPRASSKSQSSSPSPSTRKAMGSGIVAWNDYLDSIGFEPNRGRNKNYPNWHKCVLLSMLDESGTVNEITDGAVRAAATLGLELDEANIGKPYPRWHMGYKPTWDYFNKVSSRNLGLTHSFDDLNLYCETHGFSWDSQDSIENASNCTQDCKYGFRPSK